jgi:hypothetical protein
MTQEDKLLLFQDLCARLPHRVECLAGDAVVGKLVGIVPHAGEIYLYLRGVLTPYRLDEVKPYLRSMDDMTEEEKREYSLTKMLSIVDYPTLESFDWFNAHHFDYRGLIEKGLAIAVTEENNPYKD